MTSPRPISSTPQNQIPIVKDLCILLGFESLPDRQILLDSTHQWRRIYRCDDGMLGKDLIDWKSGIIHENLTTMTREYLDRGGNGSKFWPRKGRPRPRTIPEYPDDKSRISSLVHQIFWRQNLNETRNAKNPARHPSLCERSASSHDGGPTVFTAPFDGKTPSHKALLTHQPQQDSTSYPVSFSGALCFTNRTVSRLPSPPDQAQPDGQSHLRTMGEVMADNSGYERNPTEKGPMGEDDDQISDIYAFKDSGDELLMGPVRKRSKKPHAPTAKMVPDRQINPDPNFGFDDSPLNEPRRSEKSPELEETPRRRRRAVVRLGSEEADKDYNPRKSKRKRTTLPKSCPSVHDSGSRMLQEEVDAQRQVEKTPSSSEETSHQKSAEDRKKQPSFDNTALIERVKSSRHLDAPDVPDLTQESLPTTSQSQRTVDVVQQYPAIGEHMNSFPAESQIARMNRNTSSPNADPSKDVRPQDSRPQHALDSQQEAYQEPRHESPTTEMYQARLNSTVPKNPSVDCPSILSLQDSSNGLAPSEAFPSRTGTESAKLARTEIMQPEQAKPAMIKAQAVESISEQTQKPSEPPATPFTAQDLQSKTAPPPPVARAAFNIRYTIIKFRHPDISRRNWPTGGLTGKTMDSFCDEIAAIIGRPVLRSIIFHLTPSKGGWELEDEAQLGKAGEFERIRDEFIKEIKMETRKSKTTEFTLTIEPDRGMLQNSALAVNALEDGKQDDDDDDDDNMEVPL